MTKTRLILTVFILDFLLRPPVVQAARFSFDPVTADINRDQISAVRLNIDTGGDATANSEALISFDPTIIEVAGINDGDFYPETLSDIGLNQFRVGGTVTAVTDSRTGTGTLATIQLRGKSLGTTKLRFDCSPGETLDSNISKNDPEGTDILDCSQLVDGSFAVIESASNPTAVPASSTTTPTPTTTLGPTTAPTLIPTITPPATPTRTPTPAVLTTATPAPVPDSGQLFPTITLLGLGIVTIAAGSLFAL